MLSLCSTLKLLQWDLFWNLVGSGAIGESSLKSVQVLNMQAWAPESLSSLLVALLSA